MKPFIKSMQRPGAQAMEWDSLATAQSISATVKYTG
jgi:hypothetical protein